MLLNSTFLIAAGKLALVFALILGLLRLKLKLWQAILAGCTLVGIFSFCAGVAPLEIVLMPLHSMSDTGFVLMEVMIFGIMLLSGVQGATGQSQRLVEALDCYLKWPRLRLAVFPALVGLLPMPGGALFSCPMLDAAAHGVKISPERKSLVNHWFRHIWETTWPLYPGFILVCSLVDVPLYALMKFTFPLMLISIVVGWLFFLKDIEINEQDNSTSIPGAHQLRTVFYEALPLLITLGGAVLFGWFIKLMHPEAPSQAAFIISLSLANLAAIWQGRKHFSTSLLGLVLNRRTFGMMALVYVIFLFKDMIGISGIVSEMSHAGSSVAAIAFIFIFLPMICGMVTGIMVGYVGASFPILLGIISEAGLEAYTLPLVVLGIVGGQAGQLVTPLHICIVLTCEYYKVHFSLIWRKMLRPLICFVLGGILWVGALFLLKVHF